MREPGTPLQGPLPRIRGTQLRLRDFALVDQIKADMAAGRYLYEAKQSVDEFQVSSIPEEFTM
jgi:hypothetical protein